MSNIDDITRITDVREAPDQCSPGDQQRLRIFVPNVATVLSMGANASSGRVRTDDWQEPSRAGFGVVTDGDIFLSAQAGGTSPGEPRLAAQATHDVIIQSEQKDVWIGGRQSAILAAGEKSAVVTGGGGVLIAGGSPVKWESNIPTSDGPLPAVPAWCDGWGDPAGAINQGYAAFDAAVAVIMAARALVTGRLSIPEGKAGKLGWFAGLAGFFSGTGFSAAGAGGKDPFGGTVIHGTSGLIMGSTNTMGIYSLMGTTIASPVGVSVASTNSVGIMGAMEVDIAGSELKLLGGSKTTVSAGTTLQIDSGDTTVLGGRTICIGEDSKKRKWLTNNITLAANNGITLLSSEGAGATAIDALEASKDTRVIRLGAKKHVALASTEKVSLGVKADGEVKLTCIDSSSDYISLKKDDAVIRSSTRITSKVNNTSVEVTDGKIALGVGSFSAVLDSSSFTTPSGVFDSSGVKLTGQIKLGG